jgi:hypothetical protein
MEQIEPIPVEIDPIGATWESKYISYSLTWGNDVIDSHFSLQNVISVVSPGNANNSIMDQF